MPSCVRIDFFCDYHPPLVEDEKDKDEEEEDEEEDEQKYVKFIFLLR